MPSRNLPIISRLAILCGGFEAQFGWVFFGFGMIFFWIFFMNSSIVYMFSFGEWDTVTGKVAKIEQTNASINNTSVYEYFYEYNVNGTNYTGSAHTTGYAYQLNELVEIEYNPDNPSESRMGGARKGLFGWEVIFVVIFPLVGLIFILYSFRQNIKSVDLLINGRFTHGKLIKTEPTNVTINKQPVYKYTFRFEAHDGKTYEAVGKTHIYSLLTDEKNERLIYAPNDPSYATMYDSIPSAPKLNEDGTLGPMPLSGYGNLILPLISIFFHGGYYLIRYVL
ncbi:MAG: DUF3592 domain-containing protein [Bacteroidia bacterium]|nr:DUF3592 domain-containing protein [Bacteroidia bacterium]